DLSGKVALVTGCRRGIGLAMALALASAGADIIGVSANLEADGGEAQRGVEALGRRFTALPTDLGDRAAVRELAQHVLRHEAPVDVLVNNAGTIERLPAVEHDEDIWDRVLEINLNAPFLLARLLGRQMIERGQGKMIFTASMLSFQGGIGVASYTATKSAIAGIVRALSNEWAPMGVNVNAIAPGYIATDNTQALRADALRSRSILDRIPAGRWGEPNDLAGATIFLAARASDYVCGTVVAVDGGWLAR
ncbi:MAG TPA: SDR family NAD(P)-dependent oxidoreductase, partial [Solirubrobacteraceae bacterium]|nr:SDR family NAD(P)-dependent oxidoreductase [Solirubrobacteraceae bacterium]